MAIRKVYVTRRARQFLKITKQHLADLIRDRGYGLADVSHETKIPLSNLVRWLDANHESFMPLAAAVVIADFLEIQVRDVLPPEDLPPAESERYKALEVFLTAPLPHVVMMADIYRKMVRVIRE